MSEQASINLIYYYRCLIFLISSTNVGKDVTYKVIVEYCLPPSTSIEQRKDLLARMAKVVTVEPDVDKGVPIDVLDDILQTL